MIKFEKISMPAASLGDLNPLPDMSDAGYIHAKYDTTERVTPEETKYIGAGRINTLLPYLIQDGYNRDKKERTFDAAVLENNRLKAVFIPELGGRLWSIFDKEKEKELLYVNPVFQPCNLALRNAWFSGGVEFNVGIRGHNPLTCSPLWCGVDRYKETEILRLWEFERIRGVVYSISAYLPDDSPVLYLKCKIENKSKETKHMYWWSNIAVPETEETRILVPAEESFLTHYGEDGYVIDKIHIPNFESTDISYPKNIANSRDFFYKIPKNEYKWIASADKDGFGLLQCSTQKLFGRKLFVWGTGRGGRHWNEWLSVETSSYIEIQAGLSNTQFELIPIAGETTWEWIEAYTAFDAPSDKVHADYKEAVNFTEKYMLSKVGNPNKMYFPDESEFVSTKVIFKGSDWGALEEMVRGERISSFCNFPKSCDKETEIWTNLIKTNTFPPPNILDEPKSYVTGEFWLDKLEKIQEKNWFSYLHVGVIKYAMDDKEGARKAFEESIRCKANPWAFRNLSMIYKTVDKDNNMARKYILDAFNLKKDCISILKEVAIQLTNDGSDNMWLNIYDGVKSKLKDNCRLKMYTAIAYIHLDMLSEAAGIINDGFVMSDVREGELSISHYWFELYRRIYAKEKKIIYDPNNKELCRKADEKYPLPRALDYRMSN